jgi:TrmH family RNA methyltransferase
MAVLLVEPKTFGNVGSIARSMKNFGLERLIIVNPRYEQSDDVYGFAMHARDILDSAEVIQDGRSTPEILSSLREGFHTVIGTTSKASNYMKLYRVPVDIGDWLAEGTFSPDSSLIIFGREDNGLTDEEMHLCDIMVTISANPDYPTMNLSHAAAIIFHEIWRAMNKIVKHAFDERHDFLLASGNARRRFEEQFETFIKEHASEVTDDWRRDNFIQCVKNVVERARVTARELTVLDGFLIKALKSLERRDGTCKESL